VRRGKDDTLYAIKEGKVEFVWKKVPTFTGKLKKTCFVNVIPEDEISLKKKK
jgi:ribosomal protein L27